MAQTFWLRAETKSNEFRRAICPSDCKTLLEKGHKIIVEDWIDSIIPTHEYKEVGCEIVAAHSWQSAPKEAIIVGLKALPEDIESFIHTHIYFAHVYKEQDGWKELLAKFKAGGGQIIDLEYMTDENNRRVCAFGYWAGFVGAALGALVCNLENDEALDTLKEQKYFRSQNELINFINKNIHKRQTEAIVVGSAGRSGAGAMDCLAALDWQVTGWDKADTAIGGPFKELLSFDLFVNCVLALTKSPPFIDKEVLKANERLKVISDVSCDPDSDCNMIPLYNEATTLENIYHSLKETNFETKIVAIDNLPSILPKESSIDFSSQLSQHLINFSYEHTPLKNASEWYSKTLSQI